MGSVVGERITRVIEYGTAKKAAVIIVAASGGARMYEGMLSLMQMAKTSGALARHAEERLPLLVDLDQSDHRRRHGQLCFARRRHYRRAEKHDRFRRAARDQGNHPPGFAGTISNGGVSRRTRLDRHDRASQKMRDQVSQLLGYFAAAQ